MGGFILRSPDPETLLPDLPETEPSAPAGEPLPETAAPEESSQDPEAVSGDLPDSAPDSSQLSEEVLSGESPEDSAAGSGDVSGGTGDDVSDGIPEDASGRVSGEDAPADPEESSDPAESAGSDTPVPSGEGDPYDGDLYTLVSVQLQVTNELLALQTGLLVLLFALIVFRFVYQLISHIVTKF